MAIHAGLAQGRWYQLSLSEQLANVGSEYARALRAHQNNNSSRFQSASDRMLELLFLTSSDTRWTGRRKQEITRLKENICEGFFGSGASDDSLCKLEKYFYYFGVVARQDKNT